MGQVVHRTTPEMAAVKGALARLGMSSANAATVTVCASATCHAPVEEVWTCWSKIEEWTDWSKPLHRSARWLDSYEWETGANFEQVLNWGFPIGSTCGIETVKEVVPGRTVCWWKKAKGTKSCHLWIFEPINGESTRIIKCEVFRGLAILLAKPFVRHRWQRCFKASVMNLAQKVEKQNSMTESPGTGVFLHSS